jgi:transcriptional regulator GlxA family with amidase domain
MSKRSTPAQTSLYRIASMRSVVRRVLAQDASCFIDTAAITAAQDEIISLTMEALQRSALPHARRVGYPPYSRSRVIRTVLELMEAHAGEPLHIRDLCQATQVSERTLRSMFEEYFEVGPMRLLKVRQLREIHTALLKADPKRGSITRIAGSFGVWDFSLFARSYKALYAESPSETLQRTTDSTEPKFDVPWLRYAARVFEV